MPFYDVTLSDGTEARVESDHDPSEQEVLDILSRQQQPQSQFFQEQPATPKLDFWEERLAQPGMPPVSDVLRHPVRYVGAGAGLLSKGAAGLAGRIAGTGDTALDVGKSVFLNEPLPVEKAVEEIPSSVKRIGARIGLGIAETAPKIGLLALAPQTLPAQMAAAGGIFGLDAQGKFHPVEAAIGALMPGVGRLAQEAAARGLAKSLEKGIGPTSRFGQKIFETVGEQVGFNAYMLAAESPSLIELYRQDPTKARDMVAEIVGQNLAWSLLGIRKFRGKIPSATQDLIFRNGDRYAKQWEKMFSDSLTLPLEQRRAFMEDQWRRFTGQKPPQVEGLGEPFRQSVEDVFGAAPPSERVATGRTLIPQGQIPGEPYVPPEPGPLGEIPPYVPPSPATIESEAQNAIATREQQRSDLIEHQGVPRGQNVPPYAGEVRQGEGERPSGRGGAVGGEAIPPQAQAPRPPVTPPLPPRNIPIQIRRADGTMYDAAFGGWQIADVQGNHVALVARLTPDGTGWSTGGLREGETIVGEIPPRPEPTPILPLPEAAKSGTLPPEQPQAPQPVTVPDASKVAEMAAEVRGEIPPPSPVAQLPSAKELRAEISKTEKERIRLDSVAQRLRKLNDPAGAKKAEKKATKLTAKLDVLRGQLSQVEAAAPRRARGIAGTQKFNRETERVGDDILNWIVDHMKLLSRSGAQKIHDNEWWQQNKADWDDAPEKLSSPHHNLIYGANGFEPNRVAQAAFEAGKLREPSARALWAAIDHASKVRAGLTKGEKAERSWLETQADFESEISEAPGKTMVPADTLKVNDLMEIGKEWFTVTEVNPDTGNVTLKDGRRFGKQTLESGRTIYVEQFKESGEEAATFPEPEPPVAAEPAPVAGVPTGGTEPPAAPAKPAGAAVDLFGNPIEEPAAPKPAAPETQIELAQPGLEPRPLTAKEKAELQALVLKARAARDEGGEPLTPDESKRYNDLTALAGQKELLAEDRGAAIEAQLKQLRDKREEMWRQRDLAVARYQKAKVGSQVAEEIAQWTKAIDEIQGQIAALERQAPAPKPQQPKEGEQPHGKEEGQEGLQEVAPKETPEAPVQPRFKEGDLVWVGQEPMHREGTIAASGPRGGFFVRTNLGEVFYELNDIRPREAPIAPAAQTPAGAALGTEVNGYRKTEKGWQKLDENGQIKKTSKNRELPPANAAIAANLEKYAANPPPAETRTQIEVFNQAYSIRIVVPEESGITVIRGFDSKGRHSDAFVSTVNRQEGNARGNNPFQNTDIVRVQGGHIDKSGKFAPIEGSVTVLDAGDGI